jgi:hypothetical protein
VLAILGSARWKQQSARDVAKLSASPTSARVKRARYDRSMVAGLPTPVVRYFRFALRQGQPMIERARIDWIGEFSIRPRRWSPFVATQHYRMYPPGFVWDARVRLAPALPILVRDAYLDHEGSLRAAIGGVVSVANAHGTPGMAAGELLRYLGEAVWFPTALLPCNGVTWSEIDHLSATATLTDGETMVSMVVHFASTGEITGLTALRPRDMRGTTVLTPWVAHLSGYSAQSGMQVPCAGDVEWELPTGPLPYWRGRIAHVHYDFAE